MRKQQQQQQQHEKSKYTSLNCSLTNALKNMLRLMLVLISFKCILCSVRYSFFPVLNSVLLVCIFVYFFLILLFFFKLISHDIQMFEFKLDILMVIHVKMQRNRTADRNDVKNTQNTQLIIGCARALPHYANARRTDDNSHTIKILMMQRIKLF